MLEIGCVTWVDPGTPLDHNIASKNINTNKVLKMRDSGKRPFRESHRINGVDREQETRGWPPGCGAANLAQHKSNK
jgi:hypothetical protein